jgi:error-prone DNA polymerase
MGKFVELLCQSNFSFLRGASDAREYILRAREINMPAVGICDINGVYGLPRAFEALRGSNINIKLISGAQITMSDHPPLHLIAKTRIGWGLLCRILTMLHSGKLKGEGKLEMSELELLTREFPGAQDLVCIVKNDEKNNFEILKALFPENIYIGLCRYLDGLDDRRNERAFRLSMKHNISIVATNDVHYHEPRRRFLQDTLTCIREHTTLDKAGFKLFSNDERYLKSSEQMESLFLDRPDALENTLKIANACTFSLSELRYKYPKESVPAGETASSYLHKLVFEGVRKRYGAGISHAVDKQVRKELEFFRARGEEDYFLTMHDILKTARAKKIVFQGRGSAASSIVCYALGITAVDPIANDLLFDRFANPARKDPPDIDVDFEHERREEVIQDIYARYGRDRAAMVAAVHTYKFASAYREVCKAMGVAVGTQKADTVRERFDELAGQYRFRAGYIDQCIEEMAEFPRHIGTHSGGFVITDDPLIETVPVEPAAMDGRTIVQWDKHDLETLGMMKMDILSIGFLTVIRKATDLIGMDWQDIPVNDKKTYDLIGRAETVGCFQIESRAQMSSLPYTKPKTPYEMTIQVALIRPSMSKGGMSRAYLKGRAEAARGNSFKSGNRAMDNVLRRTHGVAMFPDQIMQIAMDVCGFSSAEADQLRRSLGKERSASSVESQGVKLFNAMIKCGIDEGLATDILNRTQGFASYGFPEAHAASYGSLAFKSAYLKTHYPTEYLCALINSQPMGFYHVDFLLNEAVRNSGVRVLPVHPQISIWDAQLEGVRTIRMGFRNIRKINKDDVEDMQRTRAAKPFRSIEDFISRTTFDRTVINHLTLANCFECFGVDRRHSFWKSLEFKNLLGTRDRAQLSLFEDQLELETEKEVFAKPTNLEAALIDYRMTGYSLGGNILKHLRLEIPSLPPVNSKTIRQFKSGMLTRFAGLLIVDQRPPPAKGFGFLTLEDEFGTFDLVLRPAVYDGFKKIFRSSRFLVIEGKIQKYENKVTVLVERVESFSGERRVRSHTPTPRMMERVRWE